MPRCQRYNVADVDGGRGAGPATNRRTENWINREKKGRKEQEGETERERERDEEAEEEKDGKESLGNRDDR